MNWGMHAFDGVVDEGEESPCRDHVVCAVHAKHGAGDDGIPDMVHSTAPRVDDLEDGGDELAGEDDQYGLVPVQADANPGSSQQSAVSTQSMGIN